MLNPRTLLTLIWAGIVINLVMTGVNAWRGGWWWCFVPVHVATAVFCLFARRRLLRALRQEPTVIDGSHLVKRGEIDR